MGYTVGRNHAFNNYETTILGQNWQVLRAYRIIDVDIRMLSHTIALALGFLVFSLIEYLHHRWGGHLIRRGRLYKSHQSHHRDPREGGIRLWKKYIQRAPTVIAFALLLAGPLYLLLVPATASFAVAGLFAGNVYSEAFHHSMHHRAPHTRAGEWLWRQHYSHHYSESGYNYGFTSPLWDFVFRTYKPPKGQVYVPSAQLVKLFPRPRNLFPFVCRIMITDDLSNLPFAAAVIAHG